MHIHITVSRFPNTFKETHLLMEGKRKGRRKSCYKRKKLLFNPSPQYSQMIKVIAQYISHSEQSQISELA